MQLDLFGESVAAPIESGAVTVDTEDISSYITDLEFGPVNAMEAAHDTAFLAAPYEGMLKRDAFESMVRSGRLAKIVEEAALDKNVFVGAFDGRKSTVQPQFIPMILDKLNGMTYAALAEKYGRAPQTIYSLMNRPATRKFVAKLLGEYAASLGPVEERIRHHATEAVDTLVDIMRQGKEENRQKSAFGLLRMAGYDNQTQMNLTVNNQPLDNAVVDNTNRLLEALAEAHKSRERGYDRFVEQPRGNRTNEEVAVVEPPAGLKKLAGGM